MIKIISPHQFKTIPWKNGKGQTTELAISENDSIDDFNWRLSIASVVEDGAFSDFSGYERHLILLEGKGIELNHDKQQIDLLEKRLAVSSFNGASKTIGKLINGAIKDFNLMTKDEKYQVEVFTSIKQKEIKIDTVDLCFVYTHTAKAVVYLHTDALKISNGELIVMESEGPIRIVGENLIVVTLGHLY
ncbi:MAG: HutD family protein [Alcanivoracaceae bacterium]|nr:HutD family protein [Alcanivoracaceae bacterium]